MDSNLTPERPLIVSPTLAATIGLEEAVMLHVLSELLHFRESQLWRDRRWLELTDLEFQQACPFWAPVDIKRIQSSLQSLGMLLIQAGSAATTHRYAIDQEIMGSGNSAAKPQNTEKPQISRHVENQVVPAQHKHSHGNKTYMAPNWQPDQTWLAHCSQQGIPTAFTQDLVPGFVKYWRDRGQAEFSWGSVFSKHALREWRREQARRNKLERHTEMTADWSPSADAVEILVNAGVNRDFLEDAIPEFVLYWREQGAVGAAWNTRFIEHIRKQWATFQASFGNEKTPHPISSSWQPSRQCFEVLQLAEIDEAFALSKVAEFVLYWQDTGKVKASWNTTFIQFIKQSWARQLKQQQVLETENAENQSAPGANSDRIKQRLEQLADRSWAG